MLNRWKPAFQRNSNRWFTKFPAPPVPFPCRAAVHRWAGGSAARAGSLHRSFGGAETKTSWWQPKGLKRHACHGDRRLGSDSDESVMIKLEEQEKRERGRRRSAPKRTSSSGTSSYSSAGKNETVHPEHSQTASITVRASRAGRIV